MGASFRCFGVRIGIRTDDPRLLEALCARLPPGTRACRARDVDVLYSARGGGTLATSHARRFFLLYAGPSMVTRTLSESAMLDEFEGHVRVEMARTARRWTIVHAGVVGWRGRAILIPGLSHSGKSELVHALVRAGATYYSDEFAPIDCRGRVHPFRKPLFLRSPDGAGTRIGLDALNGVRPAPPLAVGLVIETAYTPGAVWNPQHGSPGEAVMALLGHSARAGLDPGRTLRMLALAVARARCLRGARGEAAATAAELLRRADDDGPAARLALTTCEPEAHIA